MRENKIQEKRYLKEGKQRKQQLKGFIKKFDTIKTCR